MDKSYQMEVRDRQNSRLVMRLASGMLVMIVLISMALAQVDMAQSRRISYLLTAIAAAIVVILTIAVVRADKGQRIMWFFWALLTTLVILGMLAIYGWLVDWQF